MGFDWREMFGKYIDIMLDHEGITYLDLDHTSVEFTEDEWAAITALMQEKGNTDA
jgi:hypothetical protein